MAIERKPIRRGGIKSAGYDRSNRILEIEFDNGSIIQHTAVGEEMLTLVPRVRPDVVIAAQQAEAA